MPVWLDKVIAWPGWQGSEVTPAVLRQMGTATLLGSTTVPVVVNNNAAEVDLVTYTVPASVLEPGDVLRMVILADYLNPASASGPQPATYRWKLNGTAMCTYSLGALSENPSRRLCGSTWQLWIGDTTSDTRMLSTVPAVASGGPNTMATFGLVQATNTNVALNRGVANTLSYSVQMNAAEADLESRLMSAYLLQMRGG